MEQKLKFFLHKRRYSYFVIVSFIAIILLFIFCDITYVLGCCMSVVIYPVLFLYQKGCGMYESLCMTKTAKDELTIQLSTITEQRDTLLQKFIELRSGMAYATEIEMLQLSAHLYKNVRTIAIARVMIKHCTENEHYFLIDAGTTKGVKPDMVVVCNRMLIGKVVASYPWYSKVLLISDKQIKLSVFVEKEEITAIYEGKNNEKEGGLIFVNHPERVVDQELVISAGQGMVFPYGFAVGTVNKKNDSMQVTFFSDMKDIRYCSVITKQNVSSEIE